MIRIIIADDHAVVRTGLQLIFDGTNDLIIEDECSNGNELITKIKQKNYDVVILDIAMPGKDAMDVLKEIKSLRPNLPVIIFTMNPEETFAIRFFHNGASAFINKESDPSLLAQAIRTVHSGRKFFTQHQMEMMSALVSEGKTSKSDHEALTDREFQVLHLLATGESSTNIAKKLNVSKNTISNHRNNILKKMQLKNNSELTRYAITHGIIK